MTKGIDKVNETAIAICQKAIADVNRFISDFYASDSAIRSLTEEIANWQFVTELSEAEYKQNYESKLMQSDLIGLISLISAVFN